MYLSESDSTVGCWFYRFAAIKLYFWSTVFVSVSLLLGIFKQILLVQIDTLSPRLTCPTQNFTWPQQLVIGFGLRKNVSEKYQMHTRISSG